MSEACNVNGQLSDEPLKTRDEIYKFYIRLSSFYYQAGGFHTLLVTSVSKISLSLDYVEDLFKHLLKLLKC